MRETPRFSFHPLERRGVILGLDAGQLSTVAAGVVLGLIAHGAVAGTTGLLAGVTIVVGSVVGATWLVEGRPLVGRIIVASLWLLRRRAGPRFDMAPNLGRATCVPAGTARPTTPTGPTRSTRSTRATGPASPPTGPAGLRVFEDAGLPGDDPLGVLRDRRAGTWAAVVPVAGCSFSLLDGPDQAVKLEGWRQVLGSVARPGSPVVRLQWVQRSWRTTVLDAATTPDAGRTDPAGGPVEAARSSYRALVAGSVPAMARHDAWVVLIVGTTRGRGPRTPGGRGTESLRRELRLLQGQLRAAELEPGPALDRRGLQALIASPGYGPVPGSTSGRGEADAAAIWPLAADEAWAAYRADGLWHATYWIAEWPRVEVRPDFLGPLLVGPTETAVSVLMAPVPADRAVRQVRSARTADRADSELRSRAGFLPSARRERESEGVVRREAEMVDGHQDFRFTGYVTVSAGDRDGLAAACAEVEHSAQSARVELRRLFGRQAEAFTWTLPIGRGLR